MDQRMISDLDIATSWVLKEVNKAMEKHGPMQSAHEGYAVILEELDEAWHEIKHGSRVKAADEMIQVAAMAIRFLVDVSLREGK